MNETVHATTILCIRKDDKVVIAGDGQVSMGSQIIKNNTNKLRKIDNRVLFGFSGNTADAVNMFEMLENKIKQTNVSLEKICISVTKDIRFGKIPKMEAMIIIADRENTFTITGNGDVLAPQRDVVGIGSGGAFAESAGYALYKNTGMSIKEIAIEAMKIAAETCVYTNNSIRMLEIEEGIAKAG